MGDKIYRPKPSCLFKVGKDTRGSYVVFAPDGEIAGRAWHPSEAEHMRDMLEAKAARSGRCMIRACMRCAAEFTSEGFHNRMCPRCRSGASGDVTEPVGFGVKRGRSSSA